METAMPESKRSLSDQECLNKALECRKLAKNMYDPAYRTMLEHMADMWERISENIRKSQHQRANFTTPV
jgi:hypothetical protein